VALPIAPFAEQAYARRSEGCFTPLREMKPLSMAVSSINPLDALIRIKLHTGMAAS